MILVDKQIKEYIQKDMLINKKNYQEENVGAISYDLTVESISTGDAEQKIVPGEWIMIQTQEELRIPKYMIGIIEEKNSLMRMGLRVDGPVYQPGHITHAYLRVQNISSNIIKISKGMKIAQIIFEKLDTEPEVTYNENKKASFNEEHEYRGYGKYKTEYSKYVKSYEKAKEDIENVSNTIYSNVLTIMGIIAAIFSLITINYSALTKETVDFKLIVGMNLSLISSIYILMGLISIIVNNKKSKLFYVMYTLILIILLSATVFFAMFKF